MRPYETIFILDPDLEDSQTQAAIEKAKGIITQNKGEIIKLEDWGNRKLAYQVKKKNKGHYVLIQYMGLPTLVSELERNFRVMDAVIKFQSIRLEKNFAPSSEVPVPDEPVIEESEGESSSSIGDET